MRGDNGGIATRERRWSPIRTTFLDLLLRGRRSQGPFAFRTRLILSRTVRRPHPRPPEHLPHRPLYEHVADRVHTSPRALQWPLGRNRAEATTSGASYRAPDALWAAVSHQELPESPDAGLSKWRERPGRVPTLMRDESEDYPQGPVPRDAQRKPCTSRGRREVLPAFDRAERVAQSGPSRYFALVTIRTIRR